MHSYYGITGHYISEKWEFEHIYMYTRFRGRHSAENIVTWFEEVISDFDLTFKHYSNRQ